ncbi:MAG TPA: bis(5'-nucleosyl)-tetraphosphatase (symmetrical) YqeK [Lachnospiraceae bacterium]|nr:bis(5'-nucleosyl)-tetraphosphatase (symmetrical) YqeK [Lachnospiraceae bacterium]
MVEFSKNKANDIQKLRKKVKRKLDKKRYIHTLGVSYTAAALAMRYGADIEKAQVAGILHDCAKYLECGEMLGLCEKYHISITEVERHNPCLLHAKLGGFFAMKKYHVHDKEIIGAIINHTTGRPNMNLLEKVIFVADYIEPSRDRVPNLKEIRRLAFVEIDEAVIFILKDTLCYLSSKQVEVDDMTQKTYNYYEKILEKKKENQLDG